VEAVVAVLEFERGRVAADRHAGVVDGGDEVVELRIPERCRLDDVAPAAHVAALDAVRDRAPDPLAVRL